MPKRFETGRSGAGYALGSVILKVEKGTETDLTTAPPFVTIKKPSAFDGNVAGDLVGMLTNPDSITDGNQATFTADPPIHLDPNSSYFIVINEELVKEPTDQYETAVLPRRIGVRTTVSGGEDWFRGRLEH